MRILLVCESSHLYESGGRVVRYITKILKRDDNHVKLVVLSEKRDDYNLGLFYKENDVEFLPIRKKLINRVASLFFNTKEVKSFSQILNGFTPDVVHFASFDHSKPSKFISVATKYGAKVVLQPWTMHFYCSQGFGFRNGEQCTLCANGNYLNALTKKCVTLRGIPSLIEKRVSHKKALRADLFLSSNTELDNILNTYGVINSRIFRFPIPFDYTFLDEDTTETEDYFIFYGQANSHKGLSVLLDVFAKLPKQKLKIYPMGNLSENITKLKNVEIVNGVNWANGLDDAIKKSKAVLIPSLWSSTTEYALLEALQIKKAIVVFNVGVHKDIFKNRFNAMVVEPNEIESFTNAIVELDQNIELRKTIAENGYKTLIDTNDPDKLYSQLMRIYTLKMI